LLFAVRWWRRDAQIPLASLKVCCNHVEELLPV
jgi:hypothetical protein